MTDAQHDAVGFFLVAVSIGVVAAAVLTLYGCGGSEFQPIDNTYSSSRGDSAAETELPDAAQAAAEAGAIDVRATIVLSDGDAADDVNKLESATVQDDAADASAKDDAIADSCHLATCKPCIIPNTMRCCTTTNTCGCTDFGPTCIPN